VSAHEVELRLEFVEGRHGHTLSIEDLERAAEALGRSQGSTARPGDPWLSRGFLRAYSLSRPVDWQPIDNDAAWELPLIRPTLLADATPRTARSASRPRHAA
jgi:hypothetical protein